MQFNDQQALTFVQGQAFKINHRDYEARYPDYDFARLIYVDTSGNKICVLHQPAQGA